MSGVIQKYHDSLKHWDKAEVWPTRQELAKFLGPMTNATTIELALKEIETRWILAHLHPPPSFMELVAMYARATAKEPVSFDTFKRFCRAFYLQVENRCIEMLYYKYGELSEEDLDALVPVHDDSPYFCRERIKYEFMWKLSNQKQRDKDWIARMEMHKLSSLLKY